MRDCSVPLPPNAALCICHTCPADHRPTHLCQHHHTPDLLHHSVCRLSPHDLKGHLARLGAPEIIRTDVASQEKPLSFIDTNNRMHLTSASFYNQQAQAKTPRRRPIENAMRPSGRVGVSDRRHDSTAPGAEQQSSKELAAPWRAERWLWLPRGERCTCRRAVANRLVPAIMGPKHVAYTQTSFACSRFEARLPLSHMAPNDPRGRITS